MRELTLAYRNVKRNKRRTAITLMSIICGVSALVLFDGFIQYTLWGLRETTINTGLGHIQVTANEEYYVSGAYDPFSYLLENDNEVINELSSIPSVRRVIPQLKFSGTLNYSGRGGMVRVDAAPPELRSEIYGFVSIVSGRNLMPGDKYNVVLGEGVAKKLGVNVREIVTMLSVTEGGGVNAADFEVIGIASLGNRELDNVTVFTDLSSAKDFIFVNSVPLITLLLDDTNRTDMAYDKVVRTLETTGSGSYSVKKWYDLADYYQQAKQLYENMLLVTKFIILFIVSFAILNTMTMAIMERTREIATLRAMGTRKSHIVLMFVCEGGLLGLLGGVLGVASGFLLSLVINEVFGGIYIPPPPGLSSGYHALFKPTLAFSGSMVLMSVAVALLGSLFPAYRASKMGIADALRYV